MTASPQKTETHIPKDLVFADVSLALFRSRHGHLLRFGHVAAQNETASPGTVVLTTGFGGGIDSSMEAINFYHARGYAVFIKEWVGHGESAMLDHKVAEKTEAFDLYVDDLKTFVDTIVRKKADPEKPLILSTHSMGGAIAFHYLSRHPDDFNKAVLVTPLADYNAGRLTRAFGRAVLGSLSRIGLGNSAIPKARKFFITRMLKNEYNLGRSRDDKRKLSALFNRASPKIRIDEITVGMVRRSLHATARILHGDLLAKITAPVMVIVAEKDRTVSNRALQDVCARIKNCEVITVKNATHRLWTEKSNVRAPADAAIEAFLRNTQPNQKPAAAGAPQNPANDAPQRRKRFWPFK